MTRTQLHLGQLRLHFLPLPLPFTFMPSCRTSFFDQRGSRLDAGWPPESPGLEASLRRGPTRTGSSPRCAPAAGSPLLRCNWERPRAGHRNCPSCITAERRGPPARGRLVGAVLHRPTGGCRPTLSKRAGDRWLTVHSPKTLSTCPTSGQDDHRSATRLRGRDVRTRHLRARRCHPLGTSLKTSVALFDICFV